MKLLVLGIAILLLLPLTVSAELNYGPGGQGRACSGDVDCIPNYNCISNQCTKLCDYSNFNDTQCDAANNYYCVEYYCRQELNPTLSCSDPDGQDQYTSTIASARYRSYSGRFENISQPDECIKVNTFVASCTGADCKVREVLCSAGNLDYVNILCQNGCSNGACLGICSDGIKNQDEQGIDCGGAYCSSCPSIEIYPGSNNPGDHSWNSNQSTENVMMQIRITAHIGSVNIRNITIRASGTGDDRNDITQVSVVHDANGNGAKDQGETALGTGAYNSNDGTLTISFSPVLQIVGSSDQTVNIIIIYQMSPSASGTYTIQINSVGAEAPGNSLDLSRDLSVDTIYRATKTVIVSTCTPYYDTAYNEYRGCYPNDPNVEPSCACPATATLMVERGPNDPGDHSWDFGMPDANTMVQLNITAVGGPLTVTAITLKASGTGDDLTALNSVFAAIDEDRDGAYQAGEVILADGSYDSDDGTFVLRNFDPTIEIPANRSEFILIVYNMRSPSGGSTFTVNVFSVLARGPQGNTISWVENGRQIKNTKTVGLTCHTYFDTAYNEYRGCYPNDPTADPSCPCPPSTTPDICREACAEGDLICDGDSLYLCLSGILTPLNDPAVYAERCGQDICDPGSTWCNLRDRSIIQCQEDRRLGTPFQSEQTFNQFCENRSCEPGQTYCVREGTPDAVYFECQNGVMVPGTRQQATDICQVRGCNPGQISCDHSARIAYECDNGAWEPLGLEPSPPSGFIVAADQEYMYNEYCGGIPPFLDWCNLGEKRCNFESQNIELCAEGGWVQHPDATQGDYISMCSGKVCNENWFYCDPINREIFFCAEGQWGNPEEGQYSQYCEPGGLVSGGDTGSGAIYSQGQDRIIVGEARNNTIIKYKYIPAFQTNQTTSSLKSRVLIGEIPWWILLLIVIVAEAATLIYYYKRYRRMAKKKK